MVGNLPPVGMHQEDLHQVAQPDHQNKHHDAELQGPETPQFQRQDGKNAHRGDNRSEKHHRGLGHA